MANVVRAAPVRAGRFRRAPHPRTAAGPNPSPPGRRPLGRCGARPARDPSATPRGPSAYPWRPGRRAAAVAHEDGAEILEHAPRSS